RKLAMTAQGCGWRAVAPNIAGVPQSDRSRAGVIDRPSTPMRRAAASRSGDRLLPPLLDLRGLAAEIPPVVELGPAPGTPGHDLDAVEHRAVDRVGPLDPYAEADLPDGECLAQAGALAADHHTLEDLDPGTVALDDPDVHLERVAGPEIRDVGPHGLGV